MNKSLFLIFNHSLTTIQQEDGHKSLGVSKIICLPNGLKEIWANIPPELIEIKTYINPIKKWLINNAKQKDYILIQGDFGACYQLVCFAFNRGYIPIYSTTQRMATETIANNGSINMTHTFKHCIYRKYGD